MGLALDKMTSQRKNSKRKMWIEAEKKGKPATCKIKFLGLVSYFRSPKGRQVTAALLPTFSFKPPKLFCTFSRRTFYAHTNARSVYTNNFLLAHSPATINLWKCRNFGLPLHAENGTLLFGRLHEFKWSRGLGLRHWWGYEIWGAAERSLHRKCR